MYVNKILLLFSDKGLYLQPSKLDFSLKKNQELVKKFLQDEKASSTNDQIYKTDNTVINGVISKEDKNFVFLSNNGTRIEKKNISAIIYKDGHHLIIGPVTKAADALWTAYENNLGTNRIVEVDRQKD